MSNPIGYSTSQDPPQGLGYRGLVANGSDPTQSGNSGVYWYLAPLGVVGGLVGDPPRCSHTPMTAIGALTGETYDYAAQAENGDVAPTYVSAVVSGAADSPSEFVMVTVVFGVGLRGGFPYCGDAITVEPPTLSSFAVTMGGVPVDIMPVSVPGARLPRPHATYTPAEITSYTPGGPRLEGLLMRPAPLSWTFQDPDNHFNRAIWPKSEIGDIMWALNAYTFDWQVDGSYAVWGYDRAARFPTPCPIRVRPPPPPPPRLIPGTILAGPGHPGQLRWTRTHGAAGKASVPAAPPSGGNWSIAALVGLALSVGVQGDNAAVAGAVAMAESGGNSSAVNHNPGPPPSNDRGLWQINDYYHPDVSDACAFDPQCNARAMYSISSGGTNWTPWATYNAGAHLQFLDAARAALANSASAGSGSGTQGQIRIG